jgi:KorB domain.
MDDTEALQIAISDNIFSEELSKIDQARMLLQWQNTGVNGSTIAKRLGKSPAWVSQTLKLLETDESTQKAIASAEITAEHAIEIARLPTENNRKSMTVKVKDNGMSVKETRKQVEKSIARMDLDRKKEKLEADIVEYEGKIESAAKAGETVEANEKRLVELEAERKTLAKTITDKAITDKAFSLEIVEKSVKPLQTKIEAMIAEVVVMQEQVVKLDVDTAQVDILKLEKKRIAASNKVDDAKAKLDDANAKYQVILNTMKPLQTTINEVDRLTKSINSKNTVILGQSKNFDALVAEHKDVVENYDTIREEVDKHSTDAEKVGQITIEVGELAATVPALRGLVANKGRFIEVLARKQKELIDVEELLKV